MFVPTGQVVDKFKQINIDVRTSEILQILVDMDDDNDGEISYKELRQVPLPC